MNWLSTVLGVLMRFCYTLVDDFAMGIGIFTFLTKVILFPVSLYVQNNSIKMVKMTPELNRIKIDFFGDNETIATENQKLYKKYNYNPLSSIIPLVIQIVLLIGVVGVINHPLDHIVNMDSDLAKQFEKVTLKRNANINSDSNSIQVFAVQDIKYHDDVRDYENISDKAASYVNVIKNLDTRFLGVDMTMTSAQGGNNIRYQIVPYLCALSALILTLAQSKQNILQKNQSLAGRIGTGAFSIGLSFFLGFVVPVGVAVYWVASNLLTIVQQYILNKIIDPRKHIDMAELKRTNKTLKELEQGRKKNKLTAEDKKREREDYKRFFKVGNKHLVFYSESNGFYKYFAAIIAYVLEHTDIVIHYITSDPNDHIFEMAKENERIKAYFIGSEKLITLMMRMDADNVVMTMPDLDTYQIKRSYVNKNVNYIYVPHGPTSLNLMMRKGSMNNYDSVLAASTFQKEEIEKTEIVYNLKKKEIVEAGYPLLDDMIRDYQKFIESHKESDHKTIIIAPSWQRDNIVDSCVDTLIDELKDSDYKIIVRPHPQHVKHLPQKMEQLKEQYKENKNVEIQTDFTSSSSIYEADLMISDWSGVAYEYIFSTKKPVLFINTPMKIMNPEYQKIGVEPVNIYMRDVFGTTLKLDELDKTRETVERLLKDSDKYKESITDFVNQNIYNVGHSGEVCGRYVVEQVFKQIQRRHNAENS
ncbi:MAG: membrane protein insertase YidC [Solobacterium sp.]|nr:membrane protein insertase YidC [Solobacterium sp.]